jgi:hypothetical protein
METALPGPQVSNIAHYAPRNRLRIEEQNYS